jgi:glycosyltransferase involved in cell wall biosynthesis
LPAKDFEFVSFRIPVVKLLIYSHAFAPQVGGVETFSTYLARELSCFSSKENSGRFIVTVVTKTAGIAGEISSEVPFEVVRRPSPWSLWGLIGKMDQVLLAGPAILPLVFALIRRKPVIVTHHGYQSICPNGMLFHFPTQRSCQGHFASRHYLECVKCNAAQDKLAGSARLLILTFVRRLCSRIADSNVAVSEHVRGRIALPKTLVIRNGVPDPPPVREGVRDGAGQPRPVCFAYIGRLVTEKGVPVLIDAAGILKKRGRVFRVFVIGDGPERTALQAQACSLGLGQEVVFLGYLMGAQLDEAMTGVSALVMPSICEDAAPFSVLEQMMRGRLIIGSKLGGLAEEIGDSGLTFAAGNPVALADEMERVIEQPALIASLGKKARDRALQAYTLRRMVYEYRALLSAGVNAETQRLLSEAPAPGHDGAGDH